MSPVFWVCTIKGPNGMEIEIMKTVTAIPQLSARAGGEIVQPIAILQSIRSHLRRIGGLWSAFSNGMRLIRAYNDLHRLNYSTLRDLGYRPGELDRVLHGHRPRTISSVTANEVATIK